MSALHGAADLRELGQSAARELTTRGALTGAVAGVGVDAVDLDRFRRVLARRPQLAERLFTPGELAYARRATDPVPRLATRFAAKEATMKALGVGLGGCSFAEVEVVRVGLGPPALALTGTAAARASRSGVTGWHLSLSHTDRVAVALVAAERSPGSPPAPRPRSLGSARCDRS